MHLGEQVVKLRHVPRWRLALRNRPAGEVVQALAWLELSVGNVAYG